MALFVAEQRRHRGPEDLLDSDEAAVVTDRSDGAARPLEVEGDALDGSRVERHGAEAGVAG